MAGIGCLDGIHGKGTHGVGQFASASHRQISRRFGKRELSPIGRALSPTRCARICKLRRSVSYRHARCTCMLLHDNKKLAN
jgi:hypothetical protein